MFLNLSRLGQTKETKLKEVKGILDLHMKILTILKSLSFKLGKFSAVRINSNSLTSFGEKTGEISEIPSHVK